MKKRFLAVLLLAALLTLPGCGGEKQTAFQVGDKVETYWFQFTVDQVKTTDRWMDYQPQEGDRLAVCYLTLDSTFSEAVPMNWADFVLRWGDGEDDGTCPIEYRGQEQLPDEYDLVKGEERTGCLVFEVPQGVTQAKLVFQELFNEGDSDSVYTEGDTYYVDVDLPI